MSFLADWPTVISLRGDLSWADLSWAEPRAASPRETRATPAIHSPVRKTSVRDLLFILDSPCR